MSSYFWSLFYGEDETEKDASENSTDSENLEKIPEIPYENTLSEDSPPPYTEPQSKRKLTPEYSGPTTELDKVFIKFDLEESKDLTPLEIIRKYLDLRGKTGLTLEIFRKYYDNLCGHSDEKKLRKRDKFFGKKKKIAPASSKIQNLMTLEEVLPTEKVKAYLPTIPAEWYFKLCNINGCGVNGDEVMDLEEFFLFNMVFSNLKFDWFNLDGKSFDSRDWVKFFWTRYLRALEDHTIKLIILRMKYGMKVLNYEMMMDAELKITATDLIKYYDNYVSGVDIDYDPYDGDIKSRIFSSRMLMCMDPSFSGYITPDSIKDFLNLSKQKLLSRHNRKVECEDETGNCVHGKKETTFYDCILEPIYIKNMVKKFGVIFPVFRREVLTEAVVRRKLRDESLQQKVASLKVTNTKTISSRIKASLSVLKPTNSNEMTTEAATLTCMETQREKKTENTNKQIVCKEVEAKSGLLKCEYVVFQNKLYCIWCLSQMEPAMMKAVRNHFPAEYQIRDVVHEDEKKAVHKYFDLLYKSESVKEVQLESKPSLGWCAAQGSIDEGDE